MNFLRDGAHRFVVQRFFGEGGQHRRAMHERVGGEIGSAELGVFDRLRVAGGVAPAGVFCDRDLDAGDVGERTLLRSSSAASIAV